MKIGKKFLLLSLLVSMSTQQVMVADMPSLQSIITTAIGSAACCTVLFVQPHYEKWLKRGSQKEKDTIAEKAAWDQNYLLLEKAVNCGARLGGSTTAMVLSRLFWASNFQEARKLLHAGLNPLARGEWLGGRNALDELAEGIHHNSLVSAMQIERNPSRFYDDLSTKCVLKRNVSRFVEAYQTLQEFAPANKDVLSTWRRELFERHKTYFCRQVEKLGEPAESMCDSYTELLNKIAEVHKQYEFTS